jgi:hypothetical protein
VRLLLAWLLIPILRLSIPSGVNFDGIRHSNSPAAALRLDRRPDGGVVQRRRWHPRLRVLLWPWRWR